MTSPSLTVLRIRDFEVALAGQCPGARGRACLICRHCENLKLNEAVSLYQWSNYRSQILVRELQQGLEILVMLSFYGSQLDVTQGLLYCWGGLKARLCNVATALS